ncbi:cation diffusion facilitator family transporter [Fodinisporobacter ferrooxydans]|uniref:Cation diffusion facilitator family transporter n=1 Tax=Fodinisporobacter ferrooxydans TaxID=2901836 RepID=A0ABY4CS98_9BACL|nr:cation diffusion facilitator family transporter [Alicyclobacillaceae bacterium MYW30-H2]
MERERISRWVGGVSTFSNILLTAVKCIVGIWAGSDALFADGIHSATDSLASMAVLGAISISNRPADEDHPYGHGKAEVIASAVVAVVLILAGFDVIYSSTKSIWHHQQTGSDSVGMESWALWAAIVSLVIKEILYRYTIRKARMLQSQALEALAEDHRSDVWASLAAAIGIGIAIIGIVKNMPLLTYADPVAGILVGLLILYISYRMGYGAVQTLMERNAPPEFIQSLEDLVSSVTGVERIDRIRAREHGHYILVDVRISVLGTLTIQEGHDLSREVKHSIMEKHKRVHEVLIHLNPYYKENGNKEDDSGSDDEPVID